MTFDFYRTGFWTRLLHRISPRPPVERQGLTELQKRLIALHIRATTP